MTVKELIEELRGYGSVYGFNKPVVMSVDTEGNSFSTLQHKDCITPVENEETGAVYGVCIWPFAEGFYEATDACKYKKEEK